MSACVPSAATPSRFREEVDKDPEPRPMQSISLVCLHVAALQELLRQMGNDSVPVYERVFGEGHYLRPVFVEFFGCANVLVEGVKVVDSPFWTIHPTDSNNVIVRHVTVESLSANNDGCAVHDDGDKENNHGVNSPHLRVSRY